MMGMQPGARYKARYRVDNVSRFWYQHVPSPGHASSDFVLVQMVKKRETTHHEIMTGRKSWVLTHRDDGGGPVSVLWLVG